MTATGGGACAPLVESGGTFFWKLFSERVRAKHPGLFMFGESFDYEANNIAKYTQPDGGSMSVLDFPLQKQLMAVFQAPGTDFASLTGALWLTDGPYRNPYELMTFYDNHDMARFNGSDEAFIDVHNWLFTARGIPVVYYGSEIGFMRGRAEHAGNRNYFGVDNIASASSHPIHRHLQSIAKVRQSSLALQRGLQLNVRFQNDEATFYRVYQHDGAAQIALVLLNKSSSAKRMTVSDFVERGTWREAISGESFDVREEISVDVPAHGVRVLVHDGSVTREDLARELRTLTKGIH